MYTNEIKILIGSAGDAIGGGIGLNLTTKKES